ncbi:MAG: hypothetical protein ACLFV2_04440 [Desulfurivibrionaceae bacterium]
MIRDEIGERLDSLDREISSLKVRLDDLSKKFDHLASGSPAITDRPFPDANSGKEDYSAFPELDSGKVFSWVGTSALLPRIAAVCFILVFALILRTLTDNNIIGRHAGSFVGVGYAAALIGWGVRLLAREGRLAGVFVVSGILLMYSIVWETHVRFEALSSLSVFVILIVLLTLTSMLSMRFHHSGINSLAILGTSFLAVIIDLPNPAFIPLLFLFLVANVMACISARKLGRGEWNRFIVFLLTICVWFLLAFKLQASLNNSDIPFQPYLAWQWFLPGIFLFVLTFMFIPLHGFLWSGYASSFDFLLPTLNALCMYPLALLLTRIGGGWLGLLGFCGVFIGLIHFWIAFYIYRKKQSGSPAICSFTTAGSFFFILSVPSAVGSLLLAIPVWALFAFVLAIISETCEIGGIRLTSYFIPALACILGISSGGFAADTSQPLSAMMVTGILALMSGLQYNWCRNNPVSCRSGFFAAIDKSERSGVVLLAVSLISGFCMLNIASFSALTGFSGDSALFLKGVQSILINAGAVSLLLIAIRSGRREILCAAIVVIIIGALKVFGYDLFKIYGVPLVLSVLSFGVTAAVGSMVMGRWFQYNQSDT